GLSAEADAIENAVDAVLKAGCRCGDIAKRGEAVIGCKEMGRRIREAI
ncbi:MAG: 3-isopropylmalate dehydrogenase, partial [Oscillibacter sp.]|nr:3-isopropylmalate dehydrogenase [Oscillibacter sp.]